MTADRALLDRIAARAATDALAVMGYCTVLPEDRLAPRLQSLVLLGPRDPGFRAHVGAQPEFADSGPDPLDRWSRRVIGRMACDLGGKALFPFGGPPWHPFQTWARRTGRCWQSPVRLLVHERLGLFVSFRGALALRDALPPAVPRDSPCDSCADQPCREACPAGVLGSSGYDVPGCHAYLDTAAGRSDCMARGCAVRRACPVSARSGRSEAQTAWHMRRFHPLR